MHRDILPDVIFAPSKLALSLADGLVAKAQNVYLLTPGPVDTKARNITADLGYFEKELALRGDNYSDLLKKHPFTFVTLARQVQSEIIAQAYQMANNDKLDIVHIYTNEEDTALPFAGLCQKPVVFTHHDPFNFLVKYRSVFPKYQHLNWLSMSFAQRKSMPVKTNWAGNIYHGLAKDSLSPNFRPTGDYVAYLGRIIEPKGVHLAVAAVKLYNQTHPGKQLKLKIAGKHYAGHNKDGYWREAINPSIGANIEYVGFINNDSEKQDFLGNARALIVPSLFAEPFGMVAIEALACGTPVIALDSGALPEIVKNSRTGFVVKNSTSQSLTIKRLAEVLDKSGTISRQACRADFEARFTLDQMVDNHLEVYRQLVFKELPGQP